MKERIGWEKVSGGSGNGSIYEAVYNDPSATQKNYLIQGSLLACTIFVGVYALATIVIFFLFGISEGGWLFLDWVVPYFAAWISVDTVYNKMGIKVPLNLVCCILVSVVISGCLAFIATFVAISLYAADVLREFYPRVFSGYGVALSKLGIILSGCCGIHFAYKNSGWHTDRDVKERQAQARAQERDATRYPATLTPRRDGRYDVSFVDFPGCISQGDNLALALHHGAIGLSLHISDMLESGKTPRWPSSLESARWSDEAKAAREGNPLPPGTRWQYISMFQKRK